MSKKIGSFSVPAVIIRWEAFMDKQKILLVDDENSILTLFGEVLEREGYGVTLAESGEKGIEKFKADAFDVVISDLYMPGISGIDFLEEVRRLDNKIPFIIITGYGSVETTIDALKKGAFDYITKPINMDEISPILKKAVSLRRETVYSESLSQFIENRFKVCIPGRIEFVETVLSEVEKISRVVGYKGERFYMNIKNAIYEGALNAIIHGNKMDKNKKICIDVVITGTQLEANIADEGIGFDPYQYLKATEYGSFSVTKGKGIFLIRSVMDEISYNKTGNKLTMVKYA